MSRRYIGEEAYQERLDEMRARVIRDGSVAVEDLLRIDGVVELVDAVAVPYLHEDLEEEYQERECQREVPGNLWRNR